MITQEEALEMSKWVWERRAKGYEVTSKEIQKKFGMLPKFGCGLCEYHLEDTKIFDVKNCIDCPVYWDDAKEEQYSNFEDTGLLAKCSRNYWHYMYWFNEFDKHRNHYSEDNYNNKRNMKRWAKKIVEELNSLVVLTFK